jgi:PAS domain S-box-containing protein
VIPLDNLGPQIWDSSPFSIVVTGYDAEPQQRKILYVNPAFTGLTGFAAEDVVGKPVAIMDGPKTDSNRLAECEATLKNGKTYEATFFHYRKDGTEYLSRGTVAPLIEPDGSAKFLMLIEMMVSSIELSSWPPTTRGLPRNIDLPARVGRGSAKEGERGTKPQRSASSERSLVSWLKRKVSTGSVGAMLKRAG